MFYNFLGRVNDLKFVTDSIELAWDLEDCGFEDAFSEAMMDIFFFHFEMMELSI